MENKQEHERIKDLLKPRYKVIADWPSMSERVLVDDIFEGEDIYATMDCKGVQMNDYPHLFRKLEWYEERTVEEMPEYVSRLLHGSKVVIRVSGKDFLDDKYMKWQFGSYSRTNFLPATFEEYTTYIKQ